MNKMSRSKKLRLYCLLLVCISSLQLFPQSESLFFKDVSLGDGMVQSPVTSLFQDEYGFVWIGTENGILRYDGIQVRNYRKDRNNPFSLTNNKVNDIIQGDNNTLWIATHNGVNKFDLTTSKFYPVDIKENIKGGTNYVSNFIKDEQGRIWVGTHGGLRLLDTKNATFQNFLKQNKDADSGYNRILSLFIDSQNTIWVCSSSGIWRLDLATFEELDLPTIIKENDQLRTAKVWKIVEDKNNNLWIGTENKGAFFVDNQQNKIENFVFDISQPGIGLTSNWINDILVKDELVWFATKKGLSIYNTLQRSFTNMEGLKLEEFNFNNAINTFLMDQQGSIWLGTQLGKIHLYNKAATTFYNIKKTNNSNFGLQDDLVSALLPEKAKSFWVSTYAGGLAYLNLQKKTTQIYELSEQTGIGSNIISAMAKLDDEHIVCGTLNGLYLLSTNNGSFEKIALFKDNSANHRPVIKILVDGEDLWVATHGDGLKLIRNKQLIKEYYATNNENSLTDNFITDIEQGRNGLWIATQDGLVHLNTITESFTRYFKTPEPFSLVNNVLTTLFRDSDNRLWVGSDFGGMMYLDEDTNKFYPINKENGLTDDQILEINEDIEGNLWLSSNNNLYKVRFDDFAIPFSNDDLEITKFTRKDGLIISQFALNTSIKLNEKELVFGGTNGITIFNPNEISEVNLNSTLLFTDIKVNNKSVANLTNKPKIDVPVHQINEISLKHSENFLNLELSTLNYLNPEVNEYVYLLEKGAETEENWLSLGVSNNLSLADLDSGHYTLTVKAIGKSNNQVLAQRKLFIDIAPPWWLTWWAYLIYVLILTLIIFIIVRFIRNRFALKKALFLEHLENERQQEIYQMKLDFFTNISHEFRTPLTLINGPIENLIHKFSDHGELVSKLTTIKSNSDRLVKLINELMDFRKSEKGILNLYCERQDLVQFCYNIYESFRNLADNNEIDYKFVMTNSKLWMYFDSQQLEKVIYNLISNAFKFTPKKGKISVVLERRVDENNQRWVDILIKDNGIGISDKNKNNIFKYFFQADDRRIQSMGSGIGLALSKSIVELHKGTIEVTSEKKPRGNFDNTTIFKISLQEGKEHLEADQLTNNDPIDIVENNSKNDVIPQQETNTPSGTSVEPQILRKLKKKKELSDEKSTIYIVEDNTDIRNYLIDILEEVYNVIGFEDGAEVIEHMENEIPDLLVCDIMMPHMDGLELCQKIKSRESTNHIPIILLTAKTSTKSRIEGLSIGADCYLTKPFSTEVLKLNIENLLSAKAIMKEKYSGRFIVDAELTNISTPEDKFIKKLMKIIETNIENPDFDVNELVKEIGMSRTVLYKKVQSITNHSVANLIKQIRLKKAAEIFSSTNYSISEVTFMVGFNDRKHFSKEFKKIYSATPTEYKKKQVQ